MPIKHKFVSNIPDVGIPPGWVKPTNWNDDHELSALLASLDALTPQPSRGLYLNGSSQAALFVMSDYIRTTIMPMSSAGEIFSALGAAPIDSPAFTGHPTGVTETSSDNSTRLATTAFVQAVIAALVAGSPGLLNTLDELAAAIADDPNFATTMTTALALKAPLASPALTGSPTTPDQTAGDNSTKIANTKYVKTAVDAATGLIPERGQCTLRKNGSNLQLDPFNGNLLIIAGTAQPIPDAGITLAATGLTAGTLYYIYAYMVSGTMTLEASTTAPAVSTTAGNKGVRIKTGDNTRTLVGMARPITGPAFADTSKQRYVRSWFNDGGIDLLGDYTLAGGIASPTLTEAATAARVEFLCWSGERVDLTGSGSMTDTAGANSMGAVVGVDGNSVIGSICTQNNYVANARCTFNSRFVSRALSEGYHYASLYLQSISSTAASFNSGSGAMVNGCTSR